MACYHPNIILLEENGIKKKDGTPGYKTRFIPFTQYEELFKENKEIDYGHLTINGHEIKYILAPCRMCQGCKSDRRKDWATRLELESRYYKHNYYITLTYEDEHLIIPKYWAKSDTGEIIYNPGTWTGTLSKYHAMRFIRSFKEYCRRKYNHTGIKYYLVGEYGSAEHTNRPHYHAILLNCPELELTFFKQNKNKQPLYINEKMSETWGKGFVTIGAVTWDSITYVAGYVNKKMYGKKALEDYDNRGKIPEFALMSKGIGRKYFEENKYKIYENDEIINSKGQSIKPPGYYDRLMKDENKVFMKEITKKREQVSANETEKKLTQTSNSLKEQLKIDEMYALEKQKMYNRERIT